MVNTLLRIRDGGRAEVTSVELFFDLVFVIAVTQVSHALLEQLTWLGALEAALLLVAIWEVWIGTAWITNWLDPQKPLVRLMLFVLMGVGLVMTSSLPEAFEARGLAFAVALTVFQVGRTLFILWAVRGVPKLRDNFIRILVWLAATSVLWVAGGIVEGEARLILWLIALTIDCAAPALAFWIPVLGGTDTHDWTIDGGHMAERSGLFVMIALGESVLAAGVGFTELDWTPEVVLAMGAALVQAIAIWSIYFGQHADLASNAIAKSNDPGRVARLAYTYVPIVLIAGIVLSAVGDEIALAHPSGHTNWAAALVLIGGPALFLLGAALFKRSVFGTWPPPRLGGLTVLVALLAAATILTPLWLTCATTLVLVTVAGYELVWLARHPEIVHEAPLALQDET
jgi:low temperature requirement protein LtrA